MPRKPVEQNRGGIFIARVKITPSRFISQKYDGFVEKDKEIRERSFNRGGAVFFEVVINKV